jgi:cell division protease FtsH
MHPTQEDKQPDNENQQPPNNWRRWMLPVFLLILLVWLIFTTGGLNNATSGDTTTIRYSDIQANISSIETITFKPDIPEVYGTFRIAVNLNINDELLAVRQFSANVTDWQSSELGLSLNEYNQAIANGEVVGEAITINTDNPSLPILAIILNILPFILIVGFIIWMMRRAQGQVNGVFNFGQSRAREYDAHTPRVTFDDVAGQEAAKRELIEIVDFLKEPEKYISLGARIPRGVLLVGPPGTGKTLMARAVAGEANVAFYSIAASEFVEMFVGVGASRVRDLFNRAKDNSPSIVFIDEIDAVGRQRGAGLGGGNDEREQTLNQMLAELDGFDQSSTVIVMAATNRPDVLDPALLRPGRFDRQVMVDLPDRKGRLAILKIHTRGKPLGKDVELEIISGATIGFSGADLANLANEAALYAARMNHKKISQADFTYAFERIILGIERPPLSDVSQRRIVAYHEAGHTAAALLTPGADQVLKVTITPRGYAGGVTWKLPSDDNMSLRPRSFFEAEIRMALGGRAAEKIVFGEITPGAAGDIQQVTKIARRMVTQWGMSELGMVDYSNGGENPFLGYSLSMGRQYSEETAAKIDLQVRNIIDAAYKDVEQLLTANRDKLDAIANALLEHEILERDQILSIMGMAENKPLDILEGTLDKVDSSKISHEASDDPFALFVDKPVANEEDNGRNPDTFVPDTSPPDDRPEEQA